MNIKVEFPTAQEVEVIAQKKISENPKLKHNAALEMAKIELMGVIPESFGKVA